MLLLPVLVLEDVLLLPYCLHCTQAALLKEEEAENRLLQKLQQQKKVQQHLSRFLETLDLLGQVIAHSICDMCVCLKTN